MNKETLNSRCDPVSRIRPHSRRVALTGQRTIRRPGALPSPVLLLLIVMGQFRALPQQTQLTTVWARDFNEDGIIEISRVQGTWIEYTGGGWPGTLVPITVQGAYLRASPGAALWSPTTPMASNDVLSPDMTQGGYWLEQISLWKQLMPSGEPMPPFELVGPYVGARFIAPDGQHAAWINLENPDDAGWQPEPGAALRVGDKPVPPPAPENESSRLTQIDLNGGGLDFVLRTRCWTNVASGMTGTTVTLTNRPGFKVLVSPTAVARQPAWFPFPVTEGFFPPTNPPSPASWQTPPITVLLFDEQRDKNGNILACVGPLARQPDIVVTVLDHNLSYTRTGWIRIRQDFEVIAHDLSSGTVGEPPRQTYEDQRERWDINGDGQVDFVTIQSKDGTYDHFMGWIGTTWTDLLPLRHTQRLSGDYLPPNAVIPIEPADASTWSSHGVMLDRTPPLGDPDPSHYLWRSEGYLGLRLKIVSGVHLAWFRPSDNSFAFEPRPGTALSAGVVPKSVWAAVSDGGLNLLWNHSLSNCVIESTTTLEPPNWQVVNGATSPHEIKPTAAQRYYRLRRR